MPAQIKKIISGGQTGADRAALDVGRKLGYLTGGYVPKGRLAEDGRIPSDYVGLSETDVADPAARTEANILFC
ncbi:YpsA SLOG family protein [Paraburkholderia sp. SG-MS1]|uniref:YpsA SLOG family protein n=1 Tax=Paraburkholderia sp. SG-MS1 TaxID=2023741 RepID=UPI0014468390|nr:putative molybdenum carrier protein [Paraburkholderia sp. SG-MS1]